MKLQAQTNTAPPSGFNIAPDKDSSITSELLQEAIEDEEILTTGQIITSS